MATDALAVGAIAGGLSQESAPGAIAGLALYALGGPVVHAVHDGPALRSALLRVGLPVGGAFVFGGLGALGGDSCGQNDWICFPAWLVAGAVGTLIGGFTGMLVDWVDAREDSDARSYAHSAPDSDGLDMSLVLVPGPNGGMSLALVSAL